MGIFDNLKKAVELAHQYKNTDLYKIVMTLREETFTLQEENLFLKEEVARYKREKEIEEELILDRMMYYRKTDTEKKQPFCTTCWEVRKNLVTANTLYDPPLCPVCG